MRRSEYIRTDEGRINLYWKRRIRRLRISISGIEPRSKSSMSRSEKQAIQQQLLHHIRDRGRRAYRGPIVLKIRLNTTDQTPAHPHTITKNLLDLFGKPLEGVETRRKGVLYYDDSQVWGLSVSCRHGEQDPLIQIESRNLSDFRSDLGLALHARESLNSQRGRADEFSSFGGSLLGQNESWRSIIGDEGFQIMQDMAQRDSQRRLLSHPKISPLDLAYLYNASPDPSVKPGSVLAASSPMWGEHIQDHPLRIVIDELPQERGSSAPYKEEIDEQIRQFRHSYGEHLKPLRTPIALEALIKPPPAGRRHVVHDLDNVLRKYLIPRITDILEPPSDVAWSYRDRAPDGGSEMQDETTGRLPKSTMIGLIRHEAWRLPRMDNIDTPGFVSLAIVSDPYGYDDAIRRVDRLIDGWIDAVQ